MQTISYSAKLKLNDEDRRKLVQLLEFGRFCWNECSQVHFGPQLSEGEVWTYKKSSLKILHDQFYHKFRQEHGGLAQVVIRIENDVLSTYRTVKKNKHQITQPCIKKKLSLRLDKHLFRIGGKLPKYTFRLSTLEGRISIQFETYPILKTMLDTYKHSDPLIFERDGEFFITFPFKVETEESKSNLALGIDIGIRRLAATSEGNIYKDKEFLKRKRKLRYLKSQLKSKGTRSARRHLKKLRRKEANANRNLNHNLSKQILQTNANVIVLEDLNVAKMKKKTFPTQDKNRISQVGFSQLKFFLTYKATLLNKKVVCVNPRYTSQKDSVTGKKGIRKGCRFYGSDKHRSRSGAFSSLVYDADINAAVNIAKLSHLPISCGSILDGQAIVNRPIVSQRK